MQDSGRCEPVFPLYVYRTGGAGDDILNEPGIYRKEAIAIRIENTITAVESMVADGSAFGL